MSSKTFHLGLLIWLPFRSLTPCHFSRVGHWRSVIWPVRLVTGSGHLGLLLRVGMHWAWLLLVALAVAILVLVALTPRAASGRHGHGQGQPQRKWRGPPATGPICGRRFDTEEVPESHGTTTLSLSCIDYRFVESIPEVLRDEEGVEFFDGFALAGGSLGYNQTMFTSWPQTWLDTVQIAITLHKITTIIIVEHMDCGMYTTIYGPLTPTEEHALHLQNMQTFRTAMATLFPTLAVRGYLVYLDGAAERLI